IYAFFPGWPNTTIKTKLTDHADTEPMNTAVRPPLNHTGTLLIQKVIENCSRKPQLIIKFIPQPHSKKTILCLYSP
ncbi:unnamed protein product, partial [Bubo scandiacus]